MQEIKNFITASSKADLSNVESFAKLLKTGADILCLSDKDLAHEFSASITTIKKWKNGVTTPHLIFRHHVVNYLVELAREKLNN